MVKFNEHVKIGEAAMVNDGIAAGLNKVLEKNDRIVAIQEDMGFPAIGWMKQHCPERIVECGIAEGNAAVVAAGLAAEGWVPIIHSFVFAAIGRALNQIRQSILVDRFNVKILGREGAWGEPGISHNTVEGIGMTRHMPNLVILNPCDAVEAEKAVIAMCDYIGPAFLRIEAAPPIKKLFTDDYPFELGKAYVMKEGKDATIIATGYMVQESLRALELAEKEGLDVGLLDMCTVKPLDEAAIVKAAETSGAIVTAEVGNIVGGMGEGVAAVLGEQCPVPMIRFGIEDEFSQSARGSEAEVLKAHFGLRAEDLLVSVKEVIARKKK